MPRVTAVCLGHGRMRAQVVDPGVMRSQAWGHLSSPASLVVVILVWPVG